MSQPPTVILVGAGHVHLHVAARAQAFIGRGARVVLIDPGEFWYSGLATGVLGGMYEPAEDQLDPRALIEAQGGEFIQGRVESVDRGARRLRLAAGGQLAYDYLSINVGSRVNADRIAGVANDSSVWLVKPVSNLANLRACLETRFHAADTPSVAVVGGGPTGSEVAANLAALATRHDVDMQVTLVTSGNRLIKQAPAGAARALQRKLTRHGLTIRTQTRIVRRQGSTLIADDGSRIPADVVILAIGLEANPLVHEMGLPAHDTNGLRINAALHSIADRRVFAGGDCATLKGFHLPKLGVFGVRQATYIQANLLASLAGKPLSKYEPQNRYLAILNLGDGTALATWGPFWWMGRLSMWWKDAIDRRFLEGYRQSYGDRQPRS